MELIIGILMLFGIASVGAEAEIETAATLEAEPTVIESAPVEQPAPKAEDTNQQRCLFHHTYSTYRDLTIPYGSQQQIAASCLQSCNGDSPNE
ncbi:hypothetical protein ACFL3U_05125 [Pseudomonadota bacterium]